MKFSRRISGIHPSATLRAKQLGEELAARGIEVIDLSAGEPSFPTPEKIKQACKTALDQNKTYYGPAAGIAPLRQAIAKQLKRTHGIDYIADEIVITCGAKQAIFMALQILIDPGDEVLIPAPYWVSYPEQVRLAEGKPVILNGSTENDFKITPKQLKKGFTAKTKMLILNSPSNPTGSCYTAEEFAALADVCAAKGVWVLSDEIYDRLTFDGFRQVSFAAAAPQWREKTILVNGASKAYSMTGWRMGYLAAPAEFIAKSRIWQSQEITTIPSFVQQACVTAFNDCDAEVAAMAAAYQSRRDLLHRLVCDIPKIKCAKPKGAFFLFPDMRAFKIPTETLAEILLEKAHVSVVAGDGFGAPGFLRLSFVADETSLEQGAAQIREVLEKL